MNRRAAKSLIEMVTVMAIFSVVMVTGARLLILVMQADAAGGQAVAVSHTTARMARQFRRDVHAARSARLEEPDADKNSGATLVLELGAGRQAVWKATSGDITRTLTGGDGPLAIESYRLPRGRNAFERTTAPETVVLIHVREPATGRITQSPHAVRIAAVRGRDLRFSTSDSRRQEN